MIDSHDTPQYNLIRIPIANDVADRDGTQRIVVGCVTKSELPSKKNGG